jgi:hypothetical protein
MLAVSLLTACDSDSPAPGTSDGGPGAGGAAAGAAGGRGNTSGGRSNGGAPNGGRSNGSGGSGAAPPSRDSGADASDGGDEPDASLPAPDAAQDGAVSDGNSETSCLPASDAPAGRYRLRTKLFTEETLFNVPHWTPYEDECPYTNAGAGWLELRCLDAVDTCLDYQATITLEYEPTSFDSFPANHPWTLFEQGSTATEVRLVGTDWSLEDPSNLEIRIDRQTGSITQLRSLYDATHPGTEWHTEFDATGRLACSDGGTDVDVGTLPPPTTYFTCMQPHATSLFPNNDEDCFWQAAYGDTTAGATTVSCATGTASGLSACRGYPKLSCTDEPADNGFTAACCWH